MINFNGTASTPLCVTLSCIKNNIVVYKNFMISVVENEK